MPTSPNDLVCMHMHILPPACVYSHLHGNSCIRVETTTVIEKGQGSLNQHPWMPVQIEQAIEIAEATVDMRVVNTAQE